MVEYKVCTLIQEPIVALGESFSICCNSDRERVRYYLVEPSYLCKGLGTCLHIVNIVQMLLLVTLPLLIYIYSIYIYIYI